MVGTGELGIDSIDLTDQGYNNAECEGLTSMCA